MVRLAVAPFENLSSDSKLNWAAHAAPSTLAYDLAPSADLYAAAVDSISGAFREQAARMVEGYFCTRAGRLVLVATLEDLGNTKTAASFELDGAVADGPLPLLNELAKRLSPAARKFGTGNPEAFRDYEEGLGAGDAQAVRRGLESAAAADPRFAVAFMVRAKLLASQGQRVEALQTLQAASAAHPDAIDAAEIDYLAASVEGNVEQRARALEALTRLTPSDSSRFRELAAVRLSQRRFKDAAASYEAAARLNPDEPELWNQMGYAYAFAQDSAGAHRALEHYAAMLGSADSNALDSLGEVEFFLGDFSGAEKHFLAAKEKNPGRRGEEMLKAAQARLMLGDLTGADAAFRKYLEQAQPSQQKTVLFEQVQWDFLTGRRKSGMARLESMAPKLDRDQQSLVLSQLFVWKLETGAAKDAAGMAAQAGALAESPRARGLSAICRVIAAPGATTSGSRLADAYALLFARKYAEALAPLEAMYGDSDPASDGQIRILLAWARVETGQIGEARKLVEIYPLPLASGDPVFASLIFPRVFYLRGVALQSEGKRDEAKKCFELFLKYSGDVPDIWGEEAAARRALGTG